jgi:enediyne biosynthesis protein E4
MKKKIYIYLAITVGFSITCVFYFFYKKNIAASVNNAATLFESISPDLSGISFTNTINTSDSLNLVNFEYIYIGGGVGVGDFNNDGLQDIFLVGNMVPSKLYLNKGNLPAVQAGLKFKDVTNTSGIVTGGWPFGVSVADVNADGLPDIFLSTGGKTNKAVYKNELFINLGVDKSGNPIFKEMTEEYGLGEPATTIQSVFFDYDGDGDLDMYEMLSQCALPDKKRRLCKKHRQAVQT